jgi:hypothetical protein
VWHGDWWPFSCTSGVPLGFRNHYLPRSRTGWTAVLAFFGLMALVQPPLVFWVDTRFGFEWVLGMPSSGFLVTLVTLSGAGALQLLPGTLGVCYPTRRPFTRWGVLAGIGVGLAVLYVILVTVPHALEVHGAIWSIVANFATCITVSAFTRPPSCETVGRIHGAVEDYVYGSGEAGLEEALRATPPPVPSMPHAEDSA